MHQMVEQQQPQDLFWHFLHITAAATAAAAEQHEQQQQQEQQQQPFCNIMAFGIKIETYT
jgi:hypothetical protein